jgi:MSHA biogenesis protein MshL
MTSASAPLGSPVTPDIRPSVRQTGRGRPWQALPLAARRRTWGGLSAALAAVGLVACAYAPQVGDRHHLPAAIERPSSAPSLPPLIEPVPPTPPLGSLPPKPPTFSVSVRDVPVRDFLFAVARDARINIDIHPAVDGVVTVNAVDQTLTDILDRLVQQVNMRYELQGGHLLVLPDEPVLRHYRVDHLNIERTLEATVGASSAIAGGAGAAGSSTEIKTTSQHQFWARLTENLRDLLRETDKILPGDDATGASPSGASAGGASTGSSGPAAGPAAAGSSAGGGAAGAAAPAAAAASPAAAARAAVPRYREAASVIANPEAGLISVRATHRQHLKVREFLDRVLAQTAQQVFIEATVVEISLFDQYQQGINWNLFRNDLSLLRFSPNTPDGVLPGGTPGTGSVPSVLTFTPSNAGGSWRLDLALRLLESYGNARVLSSPRISAVNNQPALLKVTDEIVYFRLTSTIQTVEGLPRPILNVTSTPNTISVGLILQVTPQIGQGDEITLALRPTLTSIKGYVDDPAVPVLLAQASQSLELPQVRSQIPLIQTREMESIVKVRSGEVVVLGGLMRDENSNAADQIPGASQIPLIGDALRYKQRKNAKSELMIFLRPTVVPAGYGREHLPASARDMVNRAVSPLPTLPANPVLLPGQIPTAPTPAPGSEGRLP